MINIVKTIVKVISIVTRVFPAIYEWIQDWRVRRQKTLDAEAIKNAKKAKTPEERRKSAKDLFDRTNS